MLAPKYFRAVVVKRDISLSLCRRIKDNEKVEGKDVGRERQALLVRTSAHTQPHTTLHDDNDVRVCVCACAYVTKLGRKRVEEGGNDRETPHSLTDP